ncbi:transposase, partial [Vibrio cidicii]|uniref:transposase n=1 Tax=Vibrio cidicii TaxID=1763883 RepID=UPI0037047145
TAIEKAFSSQRANVTNDLSVEQGHGHWILDVSINEDACQIYKDHGAENFSCLRHMSLNMLRAEPTKLSVVGKQKWCMMNTSMLEAVLKAG